MNNILFKKTPQVLIVSIQYNRERILRTHLAERVARITVNSIEIR